MAKALKIIIAAVTGYFFIIVVLPILIILTIFFLFEFFSVDKDAMELKKAPLIQNYEQNREKFLDLLAFAGRNFPKFERYDPERLWR